MNNLKLLYMYCTGLKFMYMCIVQLHNEYVYRTMLVHPHDHSEQKECLSAT